MFRPDSRPAFKRSVYARAREKALMSFAFTPGAPVVLSRLEPLHYKLLELLDGESSVTRITEELNRAGAGYSVDMVLRQLEVLAQQNLLEDRTGPVDPEDFGQGEMARYERNLLFMAAQKPDGASHARKVQDTLRTTRVALLGLGGAGANMLQGLTALGIGSLVLVDCDVVEPSNLNRQVLYRESDVGRKKTDVLLALAPHLNSGVDIEIIEKRLASPEDIAAVITGADLALLAADSPRELIFSWMNQAAQETGVDALFTMGVTQRHVRAGPLVVPGKTVCRDCALDAQGPGPAHAAARKINRRYRHGVILPHLQILAGLMVLEALKHLTGFAPCRLYNQILHQNLFTHEITLESVHPLDDCPYCRHLTQPS